MTAARRLAPILAADIVRYSRLMGEDETGTARAVREHREAARPIVADHGGRIVKTTGDGLLLEFLSVVAAVECAIAIQKLMVERNAWRPEAKRIVYRIGVNLGDVLIEGDDILGDGVNIAARLEGLCDPGGVLISGTAYDHVRGKIDAHFVDLGDKDLKNVARPDLFDMQDEIVARLAGSLNALLVAAEARRAEQAPKPDSIELNFQGLACFNKGVTPDNLARARSFFGRALATDPGNLDVLIGSGLVDLIEGALSFVADPNAAFGAAEAKLTKALSSVTRPCAWPYVDRTCRHFDQARCRGHRRM
jgi:class 3 adenylate cyclase